MKNARVILIADPNPYVRSFLSRELRVAGYQTVEAGACREFYSLLQGGSPPDLVILELDFPIITGLNMLERIQRFIPPVPQVIYTHLTEYEHHPNVGKAAAFVEKNDDPEALFQAIHQVLGRSGLGMTAGMDAGCFRIN